MNNNSLTFARASGHALLAKPVIAERAGRAAQALPAVLALPTATGHYDTWSGGPAYRDTRPSSEWRVTPGQAGTAGTHEPGFRRINRLPRRFRTPGCPVRLPAAGKISGLPPGPRPSQATTR